MIGTRISSIHRLVGYAWRVIHATCFLLLLGVILLPVSTHAATIYVKAAAAGLDDGSSWTDAYTDLQDALAAASSSDKIRVAAGVYIPGVTETDTFQLKNGVDILGGYEGAPGTAGPFTPRDSARFITVLSGDIDSNDTTDANGIVASPLDINGNNSFHVVNGSGTDSSAKLDGFIITAGQADGGGDFARGGGVYLGTISSNPTLDNLTIIGNLATDFGGGMYSFGSTPDLFNVTFLNNSATNGGGMHNNISSPTLLNVMFSGNQATNGGGMYNLGGSPTLTNLTFSGNIAASDGGGIFNITGSDPTIDNTIFWGNMAFGNGSQIFNSDVGSTPTIDSSLIQDGCPDGSTCASPPLIGDPQFLDADGPDGIAGTLDDDLRVARGSPALEAGNNDLAALLFVTRDLAFNPRFADADGDLTATIDMGAFESPPSIIYVRASGGPSGDGTTWLAAFRDLQDALAWAIPDTQIWVAEGKYVPGPAESDTFQLLNGVEIYGGFEGMLGTEGDFDVGDVDAFVTILSGDIAADDITGAKGVTRAWST